MCVAGCASVDGGKSDSAEEAQEEEQFQRHREYFFHEKKMPSDVEESQSQSQSVDPQDLSALDERAQQSILSSDPDISQEASIVVEDSVSRDLLKKKSEDFLIRVGLLIPLSGSVQVVGESLLYAAELALFRYGLKNVVLTVYDTAGTEHGAKVAAQLAAEGGVDVILGPLFEESTEGVAEVAQFFDIPVISFTPSLKPLRPGIYSVGFFPEDQVRQILSYKKSTSKTKIRNIAVFAPRNQYGLSVGKITNQVAKDYGMVVKKIVFLKDVSHVELEQSIAQLAESDFDLILLPFSGEGVREVAAWLQHKNILRRPYEDKKGQTQYKEVDIIGLMTWGDVPGIYQEKSLLSRHFVAPGYNSSKVFQDSYKENFQKMPYGVSVLAFDAMSFVLEIIQQEKKFSVVSLKRPEGFYGASGLVSFQTTGTVSRRYDIVQVQRYGLEVVQEAEILFD